MTATQGPRLAFMTHVAGRGDPARIVRDAVEAAIEAERLGYDSFWVAQHHLRTEDGVTASPFPLLAAVAARTSRIRLGTAVVVLPLEDPRRVAQDAEFVDLLSSGRLRLGLGTGTAPRVFERFGVPHDQRHALFEEKLARLVDILGDAADPLLVNPGAISGRISIATGTAQTAATAGEDGFGLLLGRIAFGGASLPDQQAAIIDAYDAALDDPSRRHVGVTRSVWPAASKAASTAAVEDGARSWAAAAPPQLELAGLTAEQLAERLWIHTGTAEEIAHRLAGDAAVTRADELVLQFQPGLPDLAAQLDALAELAEAVPAALALGAAGRSPSVSGCR